MSTPEPDLSQYLPPHLYRQLQAFQQQQGHPTLMAALSELLQTHFAQAQQQQVDPGIALAIQQQLDNLENRLYTLTKEVVGVRQLVPDQCDRLREQLAAVRLSHSGLLENLRQRVDTLEQQSETVSESPLTSTPPLSPPPSSD